jgi:hypothetical protein
MCLAALLQSEHAQMLVVLMRPSVSHIQSVDEMRCLNILVVCLGTPVTDSAEFWARLNIVE